MSKDTTPRPHAERAEAADAIERAAEQISQRLAISAADANRGIREFMAAYQEKP